MPPRAVNATRVARVSTTRLVLAPVGDAVAAFLPAAAFIKAGSGVVAVRHMPDPSSKLLRDPAAVGRAPATAQPGDGHLPHPLAFGDVAAA